MNWKITAAIVLGIAATIAVGSNQCGRAQERETLSMAYGAEVAVWPLWEVHYTLIAPWFPAPGRDTNGPWVARLRWKDQPTVEVLNAQIPRPEAYKRYTVHAIVYVARVREPVLKAEDEVRPPMK